MTTTDPATTDRLRRLGAMMVAGLLVQFLLGMANTFWLSLPPSGSAWNRAGSNVLLMGHIALGTALLVFSIWIGALAKRHRDRTWLTASNIGISGLFIAFAGGAGFLSDVSSDASSYVMAVGYAVAVGGYAYGLYRLPRGTSPVA